MVSYISVSFHLIIPRGNNVFPLCIKWASRAFLTASSLLGNLFKDIYFFAFFCLLLHRFAVSISLQFNCTDPGQQLGDPALRILIGLICCCGLAHILDMSKWLESNYSLTKHTEMSSKTSFKQSIKVWDRVFLLFFSLFFFWGGAGGGELGREKNHDYISRDPHTENHKIYHPTLRLYLRLCWM